MVKRDMEKLATLITCIQVADTSLEQKREAFDELARRFQDMAYGCAYSVLGEHDSAQDAAQEAFIIAYQTMEQLLEPKAFPGWLRRIVLSQCHRLIRGK